MSAAAATEKNFVVDVLRNEWVSRMADVLGSHGFTRGEKGEMDLVATLYFCGYLYDYYLRKTVFTDLFGNLSASEGIGGKIEYVASEGKDEED